MRRISVLLVSILLCATLMVGCSAERDSALFGTWQCNLSLSELFSAGMDANTSGASEMPKDDVTLTLSFGEDGVYALSVDLETIQNALDGLTESLNKLEENSEKVSAATGMDVAGMIEGLKKLLPETEDSDTSKAGITGRYKTEGGRISVSLVKFAQLYLENDVAYIVEDGALTLTELGGEKSDLAQKVEKMLPLTFEKID